MSMTMTQKILAKHAGLESVVAGQLIEAKLDMVLGNDVTSPVAINEMTKFGKNSVFDKTKISLVMDHFTPNKDIQSAQNCKQVREFAKKYDITHYYDVGNTKNTGNCKSYQLCGISQRSNTAGSKAGNYRNFR